MSDYKKVSITAARFDLHFAAFNWTQALKPGTKNVYIGIDIIGKSSSGKNNSIKCALSVQLCIY